MITVFAAFIFLAGFCNLHILSRWNDCNALSRKSEFSKLAKWHTMLAIIISLLAMFSPFGFIWCLGLGIVFSIAWVHVEKDSFRIVASPILSPCYLYRSVFATLPRSYDAKARHQKALLMLRNYLVYCSAGFMTTTVLVVLINFSDFQEVALPVAFLGFGVAALIQSVIVSKDYPFINNTL